MEELYSAMFDMLKNPKIMDELGSDLRKVILSRYTWKKTAEQYVDLARNL